MLVQGFALGAVQIADALTGNLLIVLAAGTIAVFLSNRPFGLRVQRHLMGTVLGALAVKIATDLTRPVAVQPRGPTCFVTEAGWRSAYRHRPRPGEVAPARVTPTERGRRDGRRGPFGR